MYMFWVLTARFARLSLVAFAMREMIRGEQMFESGVGAVFVGFVCSAGIVFVCI